ncbi:MAG: lysoplasmalogenase [Chloroflexi bacterium]|nr:lysoplasmalogenase [Chloroflexota bacterium]
MTSVALAGLAAAGVAALVDWFAVARGDARLERVAKPLVMGILIVTVLLSDPDASRRSLLLAVALAASMTGDLLLLPPERFTFGLIAFFAAHLAYLGVFLLLGPLHADRAAIGALVAAGVLLGIGRGILAGATRAGMRRPVGAYLAVILLMAVAAGATGSLAATLGSWAFVTSDAILGWDRFAAAAPGSVRDARARRLAVIVTYHVAQLLLTTAVLAAA